MTDNTSKTTSISLGVVLGAVQAMLISWEHTQSVLWTLLHGIFGWFYVIYSLIIGRAHL